MKQCSKCREIKELSEFHICSNSKDGCQSYCKECGRKHRKGHRSFTPKQYEVLQVIDALKEQFGRFPTYSELAKRFGTTRQDISSCLGRIKSCYEMIQKEPSFEEIDAFSAAAVSIANGWVALRVHLENGEIASQKVTFRKKADAMLNGEVQK